MTRSLIYSLFLHSLIVLLTILSLPFMTRHPIDLPPIVSVEFIQITDKTSIPYAPKARKIIEKVKEEEKRIVSEQAPPSAKAKEKPDRIPMPKEQKEKKELVKKNKTQKKLNLRLDNRQNSKKKRCSILTK